MSLQKSTTVRFESSPALLRTPSTTRTLAPRPPSRQDALHSAFRLLEVVSPRAAAQLATRLWFTLPSPPATDQRSKRAPADGTPFTVRHDGVTVRGATYGPDEAPTAVLVHGWGGWWQQLSAHVQPLLDAGYRVVAYDAPSHGGSPQGRHGASTTALEMADAFSAVVWQQGPADLVVAHSLGAMSVMWARETRDVHAGSYVFIAPGTSVPPMIDSFQEFTGLGARSRILFEDKLVQHFGYPFDAFEATAMTERAVIAGRRPPMLAIHDLDDHDVSAAGTGALSEAWPGSDLILTEGLGHRRVLWNSLVVGRVAEFASAVRPTRGAPA